VDRIHLAEESDCGFCEHSNKLSGSTNACNFLTCWWIVVDRVTLIVKTYTSLH
jgi:hypothetical protein